MIVAEKHSEKFIFRKSVVIALGFVFFLWFIRTVEDSMTLDFGVWGILPRSITGLVGIFAAPLIHGSALHLLSNTFPLILLLIAVFYFYDKIAKEVFLWIYFATGFWVWVVARQAYHIGSSGLVYGLAAFLFFSGIFRRDVRSTAVAVAIAFIHGGMVQGLVPGDNSVSWESHLLGSMAGIFCSFYFRKEPHIPSLQDTDTSDENSANRMSSTYKGYSFSKPKQKYVYHFKPSESKDSSYYYDLETGEENESFISSKI
ncbi:membrane associated rhomboid family serine protease [Catalinimonas alkaloidigena]|uniref:rhomboid family intramembrane serine protease n=1 Tax=Catalinimonas alkaloidigena TaxID=1075417 RepID=UPI002404D0AB|nr:rhomboid family intramembrane serine protease [Catalinimonas alkaloidigena]MDF9801197.1 membrane associated rhomboid family serine protease [Catalinimonas alkaloidigena]